LSVQPSDSRVFRLEELEPNQSFTVSQLYSDAEMDEFERLSGDHSPLHVDAAATQAYGYPDRLVYGFLFLTLLSRMVGTHLYHAVCASVAVDFVNPVYPGETVELVATVDRIQSSLRSVVFKVRFQRGADVVGRGKLTTVFLDAR